MSDIVIELPKSCEKHQSKYHGNAWKDYTLAELGQWVHLFVKRAAHRSDTTKRAKDLSDAQNYLHMMQAHIDAAIATEPNEILAELPMAETSEPKLKHQGPPPLVETAADPLEISRELRSTEEGLIFDEDHNIIAISTQPGNRGYDPDAHEKQIRIFCDGKHIETAHTADVEAGVVKYYEKNDQGRIKTRTMGGRVEIKAYIPDGQVEISGN